MMVISIGLSKQRALVLLSILVAFTILANFFLLNSFQDDQSTNSRQEFNRRTKHEPGRRCSLSPDASSAIQRMKTDECKEEVHSLACSIQDGTLHEQFPPNQCSNYDSRKADAYLGCYADNIKSRVLKGHKFTWNATNSMEKCSVYCSRAGYVYYGVEFGVECFCGDDLSGSPRRLEESACETHACPAGGEGEKCGGYETIRIWRTGYTERLVWPKPRYIEVKEGVEEAVKIMFLLQLNGRNIRQVRQMLRSMYSPRHEYYIHVDGRQALMLREARRLSSLLPNVGVSRRPRSTIWGGASLLPMILDAVEDTLPLSWDFLINVSESDEMVLSLQELEAQLAANKGTSFLATHGRPTAEFLQKQGMDKIFIECENRMWRIGDRTSFPHNVGLNGGSDWVVIHRSLAEYAIAPEEKEELPSKLRRLFETFLLPVESFFHSLALNSRHCHSVKGGNLRMTNWFREQGCKCKGLKKVVDWCGCSPIVYTSESASKFDVEKAKLRTVGTAYFARKFDSVVSTAPIRKALQQSSRLSSISPFDWSHPRAESIHINLYSRDVDTSTPAYSSFLRALIGEKGTLKMDDLFVYREKDGGVMKLVSSFTNEEGIRVERLHSILQETHLEEELQVDSFVLEWASIGVGIDHKEEIFRGYDGFISIDGEPTLLLQWTAIEEIRDKRSSPSIKIKWHDGSGRHVATQTVPPYDSTRGRQFAELPLPSLDDVKEGVWSVVVEDTKGRPLGSVTFPVFSVDDQLSEKLVHRFYPRLEECRESSCSLMVWSSDFPDPNSDIDHGWDEHRGILL